jgi:hypothetical protein
MPEHLNEAKDCARRSMSCAEGGLNQGNALLAKLVLADLLSHDWKNPTGDNTSHSEALAVTDELKTSIPNFTKEIQSRYLVIRCKVLLASKDINYPLIEEMANNAKTLDHECFEAFQILEEMARRQGGDD